MNIPEEQLTTLQDRLTAYVELQTRAKLIEVELKEMKEQLEQEIQDDYMEVEGVVVFKRKKGSVRKILDKKMVENFLQPEQYQQCFKESTVKPSCTIMSWANYEAMKQHAKGNEDEHTKQ